MGWTDGIKSHLNYQAKKGDFSKESGITIPKRGGTICQARNNTCSPDEYLLDFLLALL